MLYLFLLTLVLVGISYYADKQKTIKALKMAGKRLIKMGLPFTFMLILVSLALLFITEDLVTTYVSKSNPLLSAGCASLLGSISLMPGFIAFPLSNILKQNGVSYFIIAAFTNTLMMVGIVTFPVEQSFLGTKAAFARNAFSFCISLTVALITGVIFGELL